jgi:hypothetical protein
MRHATVGLAAVLAVAGLLLSLAVAAEEQPSTGTVEVKLGTAIARTWDQVKTDNYAYGPKQDFDAKTNETHIYLPYGNNPKLYGEVRGVLIDPKVGGVAKFHSSDGKTNTILTYKLHFDKPIGAFRFQAGWTEYGLSETTVAGVEYSEDGKTWKPIYEVKGADTAVHAVPAFVKDFKATDLNTQTLHIRYYTRDPKNPEASGPGRWIHFWMSGDPKWGDAARSFFARQIQVWVTQAGETKDGAAKPAGQ